MLCNPFWDALQGPQRDFALVAPHACRYRAEYASQGALRADTPAAWADLQGLTLPGETLDLFHQTPLMIREGWDKVFDAQLVQMHLNERTNDAPALESRFTVRRVREDDMPAALALVELTKPGPFRACTVELGVYLGVWAGDRLVAMAGQRANLDGHVEISAVCTHPDFRRQGLALTLVAQLIDDIHARGKRPFLHVNAQNHGAIETYRQLGFEVTGALTVTVVRRNA